jgi:hypothetical protein
MQSTEVVTNEQKECAYFSAFAVAVSFLLTSDPERAIQDGILDTRKNRHRSKRNTFRFWSHSGSLLSRAYPLLNGP